jgi:hypothetical protein
MACIACGLALDATGKGYVEIDTEGGLECQGTGDHGTSNVANVGLAIKVNPTTGNSLLVDGNGVYVPDAFRLKAIAGSANGGVVGDPLFGEGGSTYITPPASIALTNPSSVPMTFLYQAGIYYNNVTDVPVWMELAVQEAGAGYQVRSAIYVEAGSVVAPLVQLPIPVGVDPGTTKQIDAKMVLYRGNLNSFTISLVAWGGYS